jgi:predicted MPP superfamily phosphohydrolase
MASIMPTYRFVHLSDIHFGQKQGGKIVVHEDVRRELINDCERFSQELGERADGILISGDTAFSGKSIEYESAGEWLDRVAKAIGCKSTSVFVVPGNHDVDLDEIDDLTQMAQDLIRTKKPTEAQEYLDRLSRRNDRPNPLLEKLRAYVEFAEQYGCGFQSSKSPIWAKNLHFGDRILRLVGLTSVQVSDLDDAPAKLVLGSQQYIIDREPNVEYLVMMHHPVDWFIDKKSACNHLYSRARVVVFGHEHLSSIEKRSMMGNERFERLEIYAGAVTPPEDGDGYGYTYNWLEFSVVPKGAQWRLVVRVHPRVWDPASTQFICDSTRLQGDRFRDVELACTEFKGPARVLQQTETPNASSSDNFEALKEARQMSVDDRDQPKIVANQASVSDDDFASLRLLFWRYLTWQDRLRVLATLDILPNTAEKPLPQTLERMALDLARTSGRLPQLWDAVMQHVPPEKRLANPYSHVRKDKEDRC